MFYAGGVLRAYFISRERRTVPVVVGLVAGSAATATATLTTEAIAAVDGPVAAGAKRYGSLIAAFGANHRVHLAGTPVITESAAAAIG